MPFLDRSWWLRIAGGLALIIAAFALANVYSASTRTSRSAVASSWPGSWPGAIFTLLPLLAIVVALWWGYGAWRARQRAVARSLALAGNLDAMPFAAFSGDPAQAPDLASEPLVIMWRPNQKIQRAIWLIALLTLALDIVIIYGARALMGVKLPVSVNFASFWPRLALISAILLLVALHIAILLAAPLALRLRTGATFTKTGVQERFPWGVRRFLRWEDARLFEVEAIQTLNRRYTLYGPRGAVSWRDEIPAYDSEAVQQRDHENYVPDGIAPEEMSRRLRAALALVAARTGLAPRTLSPTLQQGASPSRTTSLRLGRLRLPATGPLGSALLSSMILPLFFLPAALGVAFVFWQPAHSPTVNILSAMGLVAASEILLVALALSLSGVVVLKRTGRPNEREASPDLADGARYVMPLSSSYLSRPWSAALGLLLLIGGIPGIILLCLFVAEYLSVLFFPSRVQALLASFPPTLGAFAVAALSFCAGAIGLGLAFTALSSNKPWRKQVQASAEGLRVENGAITRTLPWDAIETLTLITVGATPKTYLVTGDTGKFSLSWRAQPDTRLGGAAPKGATLLAPDALAALIEQQPGVRRRIRVIGMPEPPQGVALPEPSAQQQELAEPELAEPELAEPELAEPEPPRLSEESVT
jgi:hypothetical protein